MKNEQQIKEKIKEIELNPFPNERLMGYRQALLWVLYEPQFHDINEGKGWKL